MLAERQKTWFINLKSIQLKLTIVAHKSIAFDVINTLIKILWWDAFWTNFIGFSFGDKALHKKKLQQKIAIENVKLFV